MTTATAYKERFIIVNNVQLRCLDWGTEGKPAMICMHGHTGQAHIWDEFALAMSPHYHVLAVDQRGHGGSGWAVDGYARDRFVEDLAALIDRLELKRVTLVGLSMGGWNALLYAAERAGMADVTVDRIIIVDIAPERSDAALQEQTNRPPTPLQFYTLEEAFAWARAGNPWADEARLRKDMANRIEQRPTGKWAWKADPVLFNSVLPDNQDPKHIARYWRSLDTITCPILEVRGKESVLVSDDIIERMKKANDKFSSVDVEDAGHVVTVDKPQEFIAATKGFLGVEG